MKTLTLTPELWEELDLPYSYVEKTFSHSGRWHDYYDVVFKYQGAHWMFVYGFGSTEMQEDEDLFDYEPVEAIMVEQKAVTIKQWVSV